MGGLTNFPLKLKYIKLNRSTCFSRKIRTKVYDQIFLLSKNYRFALVADEPGLLSLIQLKTLFRTLTKEIKPKRNIKRSRSDSTVLRESSVISLELEDKFLPVLTDSRLVLNIKNSFRRGLKRIFLHKLKKNRKLKKSRFSLTVNTEFPISKKPLGIRMGKGKSDVSGWVSPIPKGLVLIQIRKDVNPEKALLTLHQAKLRLPFKTQIVFKNRSLSFWRRMYRSNSSL